MPDLEFEQKLWSRGMQWVAGADEVGRGCFAGPVTAGCVVFSSRLKVDQLSKESIEINDSKKVSPKNRMIAARWIKENALIWGIGSATVSEINQIGIGKAVQRAFRRAVSNANKRSVNRIEFLLIDAFYVPHLGGLPIRNRSSDLEVQFNSNSRQLAIKKGDTRSLSIAAASIIAKEYRDDLMKKLGNKRKFIKYDWENNKGYASKKHTNAIIEHGVCSYHRTQFVDSFLMNQQTSQK